MLRNAEIGRKYNLIKERITQFLFNYSFYG